MKVIQNSFISHFTTILMSLQMKCKDDAMGKWLVLVSLLRVLWIGYFRVPETLTFKTTISAKPFLWKWDYLHENKKLFFTSRALQTALLWNRDLNNWQKAYCARPIACLEFLCNISSMRLGVSSPCRWNTEKRVENTTRSGVFLMNFEVFHLVMKRCVECLILLLKQNDFRRRN